MDDTGVPFASHHWTTWGQDNIQAFLTEQRDLYAYLHDTASTKINPPDYKIS